MDLKILSTELEKQIALLFKELDSSLEAREDSRAFGAMIEKRIKDNWATICANLGYEPMDMPGRRTIFDCAFKAEGKTIGIDVKTKDLDSTSYSDGGICAVGNLLKFLANDNGIFIIIEFGHTNAKATQNIRDIEYIRVAPFIMLPTNCYRIENLGTGQVRLNYTINQVWDEIEWTRGVKQFYDIFVDLALLHYERVSRDAHDRIAALKKFKANGYIHFTFRS